MPFAKAQEEDQRLCMLRSINDCAGCANESIVQDCLDLYAHRLSRDAVRTQLSWLKEQGLITIEDVAGCYVAKLTERGYDVVEGRCTAPGVKRSRNT